MSGVTKHQYTLESFDGENAIRYTPQEAQSFKPMEEVLLQEARDFSTVIEVILVCNSTTVGICFAKVAKPMNTRASYRHQRVWIWSANVMNHEPGSVQAKDVSLQLIAQGF